MAHSIPLATQGDVFRLEDAIKLAKTELTNDLAENKAEINKWMAGLALAQRAMMAGILMAFLRVMVMH